MGSVYPYWTIIVPRGLTPAYCRNWCSRHEILRYVLPLLCIILTPLSPPPPSPFPPGICPSTSREDSWGTSRLRIQNNQCRVGIFISNATIDLADNYWPLTFLTLVADWPETEATRVGERRTQNCEGKKIARATKKGMTCDCILLLTLYWLCCRCHRNVKTKWSRCCRPRSVWRMS